MILLMSTVSFVPSRMSLGKTIHVLITQSTFQVHMHQCSWSHSAPLWTFLGNSWPICVPGLYLLWSLYQIIASLVKGVKCIHHPSLPTHAEVTMSDDISDFSRIDGGCLLGWMLCFSTCFLAALSHKNPPGTVPIPNQQGVNTTPNPTWQERLCQEQIRGKTESPALRGHSGAVAWPASNQRKSSWGCNTHTRYHQHPTMGR